MKALSLALAAGIMFGVLGTIGARMPTYVFVAKYFYQHGRESVLVDVIDGNIIETAQK